MHNSTNYNHFRLRFFLFFIRSFKYWVSSTPFDEVLTEANAIVKRTLLANREPRLDIETLVPLNLPDSFAEGSRPK